ncbi:hypothetical protein BVX97_05135 [bacterium E08(2017)]|nr:hypothetical protein BVX97_05135 [bacterium E08(2017)]
MIHIGQKEAGLACLRDMMMNGCDEEAFLQCVVEWIGKPAFPLVREYYLKHGEKGQGKYKESIIGHIAKIHNIVTPEEVKKVTEK